MGSDDRELTRRLFVRATACLEDALEPALAGQSAALSAKTAADCARQLADTAEEMTALAAVLQRLTAATNTADLDSEPTP